MWQEDAVATLASDGAVVRVVKWWAWDVGAPRGGTDVFSAVAVAAGSLERPPA